MKLGDRRVRIILIMMMVVAMLGLGQNVYAVQSVKQIEVAFAPMHFVFDGQELAPPEDQKGFLYLGITYLPLRFISHSLNKSVHWNAKTYTATIGVPTKAELAVIGEYNGDNKVKAGEYNGDSKVKVPVKSETAVTKKTMLEVSFTKISYIFDGKKKQPLGEQSGLIYKGRIYVPMALFVSASLNQIIDWDPKTYTVSAKAVDPKVVASSKPTVKPTPSPTPNPGNGGAVSGGVLAGGGSAVGGGVSVGGGGGNGGGNGSNGGGASAVTFASLKVAADGQIAALRETCYAALLTFGVSYQSTQILATKTSLLNKAVNQLASCDSQFNSIMTSLQSQLSSNGHPITIIAEYRATYALESLPARNLLAGMQ